MAAGSVLAAVAATHANRDASGYQAGVWAGRVAGAVMAAGLLAATVWAPGWFTHDPTVIRSYHDTFTTAEYANYHTHFDTISGYVVSEDLDSAIIGALILFPIIGFVFGALGGAIGANIDVRQTNATPSN